MGHKKVASKPACAVYSSLSRSCPGTALLTPSFGLFPLHPTGLPRRKRSSADLRFVLGSLLAEISVKTKKARRVGVGRTCAGFRGDRSLCAGSPRKQSSWQQDATGSALRDGKWAPAWSLISEGRGPRILSGSNHSSACEAMNTISHTRPLLLPGTESLKCPQGALQSMQFLPI